MGSCYDLIRLCLISIQFHKYGYEGSHCMTCGIHVVWHLGLIWSEFYGMCPFNLICGPLCVIWHARPHGLTYGACQRVGSYTRGKQILNQMAKWVLCESLNFQCMTTIQFFVTKSSIWRPMRLWIHEEFWDHHWWYDMYDVCHPIFGWTIASIDVEEINV